MKIILNYLRDNIKIIVLGTIISVIYVVMFFLYNIPLEPIFYGLVLFLVVYIIYGIVDFLKYRKKYLTLESIKKNCIKSICNLPKSDGAIEKSYEDILNTLFEAKAEVVASGERDKIDIFDYYTLWAHQIKTPIAAMNILIQREENENNLELINELFKIEQYVEMALSYLRMEDMSKDLVLKSFSLDNIVRKSVRKYARLFIGKNIRLQFKDLNVTVLTDEKWLSFVIEQILSNAIKYTGEGGEISIYMEEGKDTVLVIEDSGIGIQEEDLPRVFERGFTGFNGRSNEKSTGIGLYLCSNILKTLSHKITIESELSKYTRVKIDLKTMNLSTM